MTDYRTRVIEVAFTWNSPSERTWRRTRTRIAAVVLYPIEVKRQLATVEVAKACAVELARETIEKAFARPLNLDALQCSAEVAMFDLRPFLHAEWKLEDGTKVWIVEAQRAPDCPSWPARTDQRAT